MPDLVQPKIRAKLGRLRLSLRAHLAGEGAAWTLSALAALVAVTFILDYGSHRITHQHMTVVQRLIILGLCVAGVAAVAWRHLVRPLLVPMRDEDLALLVERRHRSLADRLISALQFSRAAEIKSARVACPRSRSRGHESGATENMPRPTAAWACHPPEGELPQTPGVSQAMILKTAAEANAAALPLRFTDVLRHDRLRRYGAVALAAWLPLVAFGLWQPATARLGLERTILLTDAQWPRETYLSVPGGPHLRALRGGTLRITVEADAAHVVPREVTFHTEFPSVGLVEETVPLATDGHTYVKTSDAVGEPLRFYVTGGDDRTPPCDVSLVEPPELRDVAFTVEYPAYTHRAAETIPGDQGVLTVPVGSWITVTAAATKDLARAAVHLDGAEAGECEIRPQAAATAAGASAASPAPRRLRAKFKAVPRSPQPAMALEFVLTDTEGFSNPRGARYTLLLVKDREPAVLASARGVSGQISERAMIPMTIAAKDDYGVAEVALEWEIVGVSSKAIRLNVRRLDPDARAVQEDYAFDLQRLAAGLKEGETLVSAGETIRLTAAARDALPAPDGPNWGRAGPLTFKVVPDAELLAAMIQMQKAMREQFRQALVMQTEARTRTDAAAREAARGQVTAEMARLADESAKGQQQVAARIAVVTDRFVQILAEMNNNRVGAEPDKRRLQERIIAPLTALSGEPMRRLAADLRGIMEATDAAAAGEALAAAGRTQAEFGRRMEAVLAEMVQLESAQELERWLKMILDMSKRVKDKTEAQRKDEERRLRDGAGGKTP